MWGVLLDRTVTYQKQTAITPSTIGGTGSRSWATETLIFRAAVQSADSRTRAEYQVRQIAVTDIVFTTKDLDALVSGGVGAGDRIKDGAVYYLIHGVVLQKNAVISRTPLYKLICERVRT